jgi:acyl carrier protein
MSCLTGKAIWPPGVSRIRAGLPAILSNLRPAMSDNPDGSFTKGLLQVADSIKQFILDTLQGMNYDVEGIDDDSQLGPAGADVSSLALVELAVRVEDEYGVKFSQDEAEELAGKTVGEFCLIVTDRMDTAKTAAE